MSDTTLRQLEVMWRRHGSICDAKMLLSEMIKFEKITGKGSECPNCSCTVTMSDLIESDSEQPPNHTTVIGASAQANGVRSVAIGFGSNAEGPNAIAIGNGAIAGPGQIAIGATILETCILCGVHYHPNAATHALKLLESRSK